MLEIESITYNHNNCVFYLNVVEKTLMNMNLKTEISEDKIFNYLKFLFLIINDWQEEYISLNIIDGDDWQLSINYIDGSVKKYCGHSKYPNNFEAFERLNQKIIKGDL